MSHTDTIDAPSAPTDSEGRLLHVSTAQFVGCLAASVTIFLFANGPLWRKASDISTLDGAIYWSYGAIPLLIAGCLLVSRRWSLRGFLLDSMALTLVKYVVTCSIAIASWAFVAPPKAASAAAPPRRTPAPTEQALVPSVIDPARTGSVRATVVDAGGHPLANAVVYVASGLEDYVFAPSEEAVVLAHGPNGITPSLAVVEVGQRIDARSTDGHMHTLVASKDGEALFNVPLLASGAPTTTRVKTAHGLTTLRCNVHPGEPKSRLLTVANPFHGRTDAEGHVELSGVPAGNVKLAVVFGESGAGEAAVEVRAQQSAEARVEVSR